MKYKTIKLSAILFLSLGLTEIEAQEVTNTSGGNALGSGGSVSYSVGQIVYTAHTGTNGSVAQGVQQPYEISIVTGFEDASEISLSFSVYPNPTTDFLIINAGNYKIQNLSYTLFDISGKLLETKKLENNKTSISLENNDSGIYFLKIIESNNELKSLKIKLQ